jgi:hypothetical protein
MRVIPPELLELEVFPELPLELDVDPELPLELELLLDSGGFLHAPALIESMVRQARTAF